MNGHPSRDHSLHQPAVPLRVLPVAKAESGATTVRAVGETTDWQEKVLFLGGRRGAHQCEVQLIAMEVESFRLAHT